jgi:hypothetical protein
MFTAMDRGGKAHTCFLLLRRSKLRFSACSYNKYLVNYEFFFEFPEFLITLLSLRLQEVDHIIDPPTLVYIALGR